MEINPIKGDKPNKTQCLNDCDQEIQQANHRRCKSAAINEGRMRMKNSYRQNSIILVSTINNVNTHPLLTHPF
jgi:hypothetical protein